MTAAVPLRGLNVHAKAWSRTPDGEVSQSMSGKIICQYFAMGHCRDGDSCTMSHSLTQEAPAGVDSSSGFFISGRVANVHNSSRPTNCSAPLSSSTVSSFRRSSSTNTAATDTNASSSSSISSSGGAAGGGAHQPPHSSYAPTSNLVSSHLADSRNVSPAFEHASVVPTTHPPPRTYLHPQSLYGQAALPMEYAAAAHHHHQQPQHAGSLPYAVHQPATTTTTATSFTPTSCAWLPSPAGAALSSSTTVNTAAERRELGGATSSSSSRSPPLPPPPQPPGSVGGGASPLTTAVPSGLTMNPAGVGPSWTSMNASGAASFAPPPSMPTVFHGGHSTAYPQASAVSALTPLMSATHNQQHAHQQQQPQTQLQQQSPVVPNAFWAQYPTVPPVSPVVPANACMPPLASTSASQYYSSVGPGGAPPSVILAPLPYTHMASSNASTSGSNGIRSTSSAGPPVSTLHFVNSCSSQSQGQQPMYPSVTTNHSTLSQQQSLSHPQMFAPSHVAVAQQQQHQQPTTYLVAHEGRPLPLYQNSGGVLVATTPSPVVGDFSAPSLGVAGSTTSSMTQQQQPLTTDAYRAPFPLTHTVEQLQQQQQQQQHIGIHGYFAVPQTLAQRQFLTVDGVECAPRRTSDPKYVGPPPIQ